MSVSYNTPDLEEIFSSLKRRVANLESAVYVVGNFEGETLPDLTITNFVPTIQYYLSPITGIGYGRVVWDWTAPPQPDGDDLTADPVIDYHFSATPVGLQPMAYSSTAGATTVTTNQHDLNTQVTGRVYAVTASGAKGPVATVTASITVDATVPPQPSTPIITEGLRHIIAEWDGEKSTGGTMGTNFGFIEVHALANGTVTFTPTTATFVATMTSAGSVVIPGNVTNDPIAVRFVPVSAYGVKGTASTGLIGTPDASVEFDTSGLILPGNIGYNEGDNLLVDGSFENAAGRTIRSGATKVGNWTWDNTAGVAAHGSWALKVTGTGSSTNPHHYLTDVGTNTQFNDIFVRPNERYYINARIRGVGASGTAGISIRQRSTTGSYTYNSQLASTTTSNGSYQIVQGYILVAANTVELSVYCEVSNLVNGSWWFDSVQILRVTSTALIEDAAITRAKIGLLAVGDAEIESVSAGKITTSELAALVRIIAGPEAGSHAEVRYDGFHAYRQRPEGGSPRLVGQLGTSSGDILNIIDPVTNRSVGGFDESGMMAATGSAIAPRGTNSLGQPTGLTVYGREFSDYDWNKAWGIVKRGRRLTAGTASAGGIAVMGYLQLDAFLFANRTYRVSAQVPHMQSSKTSVDTARLQLRHTTNGTAAQTSSSLLGQTFVTIPGTLASVVYPNTATVEGYITTTADTPISVLLAYSGHSTSSGAINITNVSSLSPVWLVIEDIGPADVVGGIDRGEAAGSETTLTYTSRFNASSINVYTGAGGLRGDAEGYGFQGYSPSATSYGDQHSVIFFADNAVIGQTARTLATVSTQTGFSLKKATLFLYYNYWYGTSGTSVARFGHSGDSYTAAPSRTAVTNSGWARGVGYEIDMTGVWNNAARDVRIGKGGGTNSTFHGRIDGVGMANAPYLMLEYEVTV